MHSYRKGDVITDEGFVPFDPAANGATNIVGDFEARMRLDVHQGNVMGGLYIQEGAKADLFWPFTEHGFVIEGEVTVTDLATGETRHYGPGEGWVIAQGSRTTWETRGHFVKSFFAVVQP